MRRSVRFAIASRSATRSVTWSNRTARCRVVPSVDVWPRGRIRLAMARPTTGARDGCVHSDVEQNCNSSGDTGHGDVRPSVAIEVLDRHSHRGVVNRGSGESAEAAVTGVEKYRDPVEDVADN